MHHHASVKFVVVLWLLVAGLAAQAVHYEVRATAATGASVPIDVRMTVEEPPPRMVVGIPLWTPGSYRLRPFPEQIVGLQAFAADGSALPVLALQRGRFEVAVGDAPRVELRYRVQLPADARFMQRSPNRRAITYEGPEVYLYVVGHERAPVHVTFALPDGWKQASSLQRLDDGRYFAKDYDVLADCPVKLGAFQEFAFDAAGARIEVVVDAVNDVEFDATPWLANIEKVVVTHAAMFGGLPFDRYVFLFTAGSAASGGGLEHLNSTTIGTSARMLARDPMTSMSTIAHEFFHVWNVKRLRPRELGPFDYAAPVRSKHLWLMEGVTSYFTEVTLARAGLRSEAQFWRAMASQIATFESAPARAHVSSEQASVAVWDVRPPDRDLNYYNSGLVLGLCLDLEIRRRTGNAKKLDDLIVALWRRCEERGVGFDDGDVVKVASEIAGADLAPFFDRHVAGVVRPDYVGLLAAAGITCTLTETESRQLRGVRSIERDGKRWHLYANPDASPAAVVATAGGVVTSIDGTSTEDVDDVATLIPETGDTVSLEIRTATGTTATVRATIEPRRRVRAELSLDPAATDAQRSIRALK